MGEPVNHVDHGSLGGGLILLPWRRGSGCHRSGFAVVGPGIGLPVWRGLRRRFCFLLSIAVPNPQSHPNP
jgi:hypothetical protein